ncbi:MAG TPA: hypothetical protein PKY88_00855 [Anaerohalosphaeraceae bacterium]|nr:hypothetical protein [Anaerohalosphaeraceae bacterium]
MFLIKKNTAIWGGVFIFILSMASFSSCRRIIGLPNRHIEKEPSVQDILGVWTVTDRSVRSLVKNGYKTYNRQKDHVLRFLEEKKCMVSTFNYIPPFPGKKEEMNLYIHEKEGSWEIKRVPVSIRHKTRDVPAIVISIEETQSGFNIMGIEITQINRKTLTYYIAKENGRLILWQHIGDPDYCEYLDFVKEH